MLTQRGEGFRLLLNVNKEGERKMNHMVYYTRGSVMYFSIIFSVSGNEVCGSDSPSSLHRIAENYDVKSIERID